MSDVSQKAKVAVYIPDLGGGGAERVTLNLLKGFTSQGVDVDLVLPKARGVFLSQVPSSVRIVDLKAKGTFSSLLALCGYLRKSRPSAILSCLERANLVAILARRLTGVKSKLVVTVHNTLSMSIGQSKSAKVKVLPMLIRRMYPDADVVGAVSAGAADDLIQFIGLPDSNVQVLGNAVVTPELLAASKKDPEHAWFNEGQPPVIVSVGRLSMQKDYETLIRAFAIARAARHCRLIILGEGEEREKLEALAAELGVQEDIALPGFAANPFAYMAHAQVYVLSSRFEGLPTVLIEALACGAAIVSTDCRSGPKEILNDGAYGRLTPVGDHEAMAKAILAALQDPDRSEADESWQPYEMQAVSEKYLRVLLGD